MLSRFYRKTGSLLGLLAILMATLAPAISQALAASREAPHHAMVNCPMQAAPDGAAGHGKDGSHPLAGHWQACGYCSLLADMPVLPGVQPDFAVTVDAIQHRVATRFERVRRVEPRTSTQPRAPPVSS